MRPDLVNDLIQLTGEHLVLVLSAMAVAMLIGVPLGILLTRREGLRRWLLGFASVMQTIPSLHCSASSFPFHSSAASGNAR
jgi:ABC-type proline/glycine betaine transport system permease subunit